MNDDPIQGVTKRLVSFRPGIHGVQGVGSSNLLAPTNYLCNAGGTSVVPIPNEVPERRFVRPLLPADAATTAYDSTSRDSSFCLIDLGGRETYANPVTAIRRVSDPIPPVMNGGDTGAKSAQFIVAGGCAGQPLTPHE
jgi:hypothetical protein